MDILKYQKKNIEQRKKSKPILQYPISSDHHFRVCQICNTELFRATSSTSTNYLKDVLFYWIECLVYSLASSLLSRLALVVMQVCLAC